MGRIVVGVSARSKSPTALRWAAELAEQRGDELVAVRAWRPATEPPGSRGTPAQMAADRDRTHSGVVEALAADVAEVLGPEHAARTEVLLGGKRRALVEAARDADLLVIDTPRRLDTEAGPGFVQRLLNGLDCPLVVVPRLPRERTGSRVRAAANALGRGDR